MSCTLSSRVIRREIGLRPRPVIYAPRMRRRDMFLQQSYVSVLESIMIEVKKDIDIFVCIQTLHSKKKTFRMKDTQLLSILYACTL